MRVRAVETCLVVLGVSHPTPISDDDACFPLPSRSFLSLPDGYALRYYQCGMKYELSYKTSPNTNTVSRSVSFSPLTTHRRGLFGYRLGGGGGRCGGRGSGSIHTTQFARRNCKISNYLLLLRSQQSETKRCVSGAYFR